MEPPNGHTAAPNLATMSGAEVIALITGVSTVALAFFAWRAARSGATEAKATLDLAEEARKDRQLAWRPIVDVEVHQWLPDSHGDRLVVHVTNVGTGPALNCRCFVRRDALYGEGPRFFLKAGETKVGTLEPLSDVDLRRPVFEPEIPTVRMNQLPPVLVAVCSDALDRYWRFRPGRPPESVSAGEPNPPGWVAHAAGS